jgi:hypothetical protein
MITEPEDLFEYFEEADPAHCFRRYVCDLSTGQMQINPTHEVIRNLFVDFDNQKSATFEYDVAAKIGQKFKSPEMCEQVYDCPLSGSQMDKLFN